MWQNERATEPEILDLGPDYYTSVEYNQCLKLLSRINRFLGGFQATYLAFKKIKKIPQSILEVGCGGGYQCYRLHKQFPQAEIIGIDLSEQAIQHAQIHLPESCKHKVSFRQQKEKKLDYPDSSFDVVTTTLVCHHMADAELIQFFQESYRVCKIAVVINDLHRHFMAYLGFSLIAPFVFPNRLIWYDGRLSVRRAFRKKEWQQLLEKAGFDKGRYTLCWHWPFRWTLTLEKT